MKSIQIKFYAMLLITFLWAACNNDPRAKISNTGSFGTAFVDDSPITVYDAIAKLDSANEATVTIQGPITDFCKGEGCWLTLKNNNGADLLIEVENKAYVLPYHLEGKTAIVHGVIQKNEADSGSISVQASGIRIK